MRTVVIYPGRFHPFHRGHKASYDYLTSRYGDKNVFVVSSDKQDPETSPFSFVDKMDMMTKLGISPGHIAQVVNPYQAKEIKDEIDSPEDTVLIFAVSEKDMTGDSARFNFKPKKDGSASYMQPLPADGKGLKNMTQHAYVAVTPTVNFKVRGADANSASQIRKLYQAGNEADREQIIADLYGDMDSSIKAIFDKKLGHGRPEQIVNYGAEQIYAGDRDKMVKENRERIAKKINLLQERIAQLKELAPSSEYWDNGDNDEDPVPGDLHRFANLWWNAADPEIQRYIEDQLASGGWTIQQVDYDHVLLKHREGKQYIVSDDTFDPDLHEDSADYIEEKWSEKYKRSINCNNPKGFSQRAHCQGRKKVDESSGYSLQGSFTPDLIASKVWLLKELGELVNKIDTVYILGSWYGNLALYMHLQPTFEYDKIINVENNQNMLDQSSRMLDHVGAEGVEHMFKDANDLDYRQLGADGVVINTSLTDMPGTEWFERIPKGTLVVLQARDQDPGEQFHSPEDIVDKFPLSQVYYTGTRSLQDPETEYQRFMVIGRK